MRRGPMLIAVAMLTAAAAFFAQAGPAAALQSGDTVLFLLPPEGNQPEPNNPGSSTDELVVTGGRVTTVPSGGGDNPCSPSDLLVQNAVLVDPGAGRSARIVGVLFVAPTDAIPPGTQLHTLTPDGTCTVGTTLYNKYRGTVE